MTETKKKISKHTTSSITQVIKNNTYGIPPKFFFDDEDFCNIFGNKYQTVSKLLPIITYKRQNGKNLLAGESGLIFLSYICRVGKLKLFPKIWKENYSIIKNVSIRPVLERHADSCSQYLSFILSIDPLHNMNDFDSANLLYDNLNETAKSLHELQVDNIDESISNIRFILIPVRFQSKTINGPVSNHQYNQFRNICLYGYIYLLLFTLDLRLIWKSNPMPGSTDIFHLYTTIMHEDSFIQKVKNYSPNGSIPSIYCDELLINKSSFDFLQFNLIDYNMINSKSAHSGHLLNILDQLKSFVGLMETDIILFQRGINEIFNIFHMIDSILLIGLIKWKFEYNSNKQYIYITAYNFLSSIYSGNVELYKAFKKIKFIKQSSSDKDTDTIKSIFEIQKSFNMNSIHLKKLEFSNSKILNDLKMLNQKVKLLTNS